MNDIHRFWAKSLPEKSLIHHMIDVGCMTHALLTDSSLKSINQLLCDFFSDVDVINEATCITAMHDIGKCHPLFQNLAAELPLVKELKERQKVSKAIYLNYRHEEGTKDILSRIVKKQFSDLSTDTKQMIYTLLRLHHQKGNGEQTKISLKSDVTLCFSTRL